MSDQPLLGRQDAVPRRRWRWLLPLLVGSAVLALIATLVVRVMQEDTSTPKYAVESYLEAVETGATSRAYDLLCSQAHRDTSLAEFEKEINTERAQAGGVVGHKVARVEKTSATLARTSYTVRRQENDLVVDAVVKREGGEWKMCGFRPRVVRPDTGPTTTTR
jgi:hypothetical protein